MSAPEPTAEHIAEAKRLVENLGLLNAYSFRRLTDGIARALAAHDAAAEARGFERGRASEDARADRSCRCDQSDGPCACRRQRKEPR